MDWLVTLFGDTRLPKPESDGCWVWRAAIHRKGYGQFYFAGQMAQAHRVAYAALVGLIAVDMQLDHMCFNRACVNPGHLQPVSNKENAENRAGANANSRSGILGVQWDARTSQWFGRAYHVGRAYYTPRTGDIHKAEQDVIELRNRLFSNNLVDQVG